MLTDKPSDRTQDPVFWGAPDLAKAGWPVFPVGPDKRPSVAGGFYAATRDLSQIAAWMEDGRANHDIAVPTGLVTLTVVIDADTAEAFEYMESHGSPDTVTARGGHWFFAHPQDGKVTSRTFAPGLDCKADGGYVVVPPSRGRSWVRGVPDLNNLPRLPEELKCKLREERAAKQEGREASGPVGTEIKDGQRNSTLVSLAGTMRRRGMCEAEIFAALEVTNELRCKPPMPVEEVQRISASIARYEPASGTPWWVGVMSRG